MAEEEIALAQRIAEPVSIQARIEEPEKITGGFFELFITWKRKADDTPPWGSWNRAQYLDNFWREDRLLPGVIYTLVSRIGSLGWTITGPVKALRQWHAMILDSDSSWGDAIRLWAQDYLCTDVGAIMELGRDFYPHGPVRKLWHLDARLAVPGPAQVRLAEEEKERVVDLLFRDVDGIKGLTKGQFHRFCSLPSTDQYRRRLGFCFLSRALRAAKLANALTEYQEEELSKMPPEGIATVTGLTSEQVQKAMLQHESTQQAKNQYTFPGILWMVGNSLGQEVGVKFIPFRRLWEKFDERAVWEIAMKTFALDAGIDVAELWQIEAHGATKAQVSIQHRKAQGKGPAEFLVDMERFLNFVVLPLGYLFAFDQPDDEQDLLKEQIRWARIKNIRELWRSDPMQGAGLIDRDQALELLAEEGVIPARFVLPPEGRLTDIQKQRYFGQVGTIHSNGYLEVHRRYWQLGAQLQTLLEVNHRPFELAAKGSAESGHWAHEGRPGKRGGSAPGGGLARIGASPGAGLEDRRGLAAEYGRRRDEGPGTRARELLDAGRPRKRDEWEKIRYESRKGIVEQIPNSHVEGIPEIVEDVGTCKAYAREAGVETVYGAYIAEEKFRGHAQGSVLLNDFGASQILAHEVGHHVFARMVDPNSEWRELMGREYRSFRSISRRENAGTYPTGIRDMAAKSASEFFADAYMVRISLRTGGYKEKGVRWDRNFRREFPDTAKILDTLFGE